MVGKHVQHKLNRRVRGVVDATALWPDEKIARVNDRWYFASDLIIQSSEVDE